MKILHFITLSSISVGVLSNGLAASLPDKETIGALRVALAHKSFPYEQFSQFTGAQMAKGTPAALAAVADRTQVYRIDFDSDGAVDRVLQIDLRARNSQFIVLHRTNNGWRVVGEFVGQEFSFLHFGSAPAAHLQVTENNGGGHLAVSSYKLKEGHYVRYEAHEEKAGEERR